MKRISIQGVISGPLPAVFSDYVDDGIVSPVNFFTKALREAEENGEDVEVWINSPGGDVDAGNEMLAAFQSFKGYKCVTVGGMAASMAAYFALQCGARVECHENTRFMFHSARTITEAGPGALRDAADAIDRINAPIKAALVARGMDEKRVEEGFRDDRALWLDAKEALALGIVQKIVKGAATPFRIPAGKAVSALSAYVPAVAALFAAPVHEPQNPTATMNESEPPAPDPAKDEEAAAAPASASPAPEGAPAGPAAGTAPDLSAADPDNLSGSPAPSAALPDAAATLADSLAKAEALAAATLKRAEIAEKALAAAEATIAKYEEASKAAAARADELAAALETEKANHAALVGKVLAPSPDPITPQNISARLKGLSPDQACAALLEAYGRK